MTDQDRATGVTEEIEKKGQPGERYEKWIRHLAQEEIQKWQTETEASTSVWYRPLTWKTESQGGAILVAALVLFAGLYEALTPERAVLVDHLHHVIGTDERVNKRILSSYGTEDFGRQLRTQLGDVARVGVNEDNPLFGLVTRTMRAAPVLAFHGEATFGRPAIVSVTNQTCQTFFKAKLIEPSDQSAPTVAAIEDLCAVHVPVDIAGPLDIPFHARFFELPAFGEPHKVWLVLYIQRIDIETDEVLGDQRTAGNLPSGLCILYNSASKDFRTRNNIPDGFALTTMQGIGDNFWIANLSENLINAGFYPEAPESPIATDLLHSVLIEQVKNRDRVDDDPCGDVEPVEGQSISVRAMVLVNKSADDR